MRLLTDKHVQRNCDVAQVAIASMGRPVHDCRVTPDGKHVSIRCGYVKCLPIRTEDGACHIGCSRFEYIRIFKSVPRGHREGWGPRDACKREDDMAEVGVMKEKVRVGSIDRIVRGHFIFHL